MFHSKFCATSRAALFLFFFILHNYIFISLYHYKLINKPDLNVTFYQKLSELDSQSGTANLRNECV